MNTPIRFVIAATWLALVGLTAAEANPHIVLLSGESLYGSTTTLPRFAKQLEQQQSYRCTVIVREETHRFPTLDALGQADAADVALAKGDTHDAKPLLGVPISLKDLFCAKGQPVNCSSRILGDFSSPYDLSLLNI